MSPHRTLAGPVLPTRPALTWWQRIAARLLGMRCARWRWYRAHVGGRWTRTGLRWEQFAQCPADVYEAAAREHVDAMMRLAELSNGRHARLAAIGLLQAGPQPSPLARAHHRRCTCEVYPYPAPRGHDEVM